MGKKLTKDCWSRFLKEMLSSHTCLKNLKLEEFIEVQIWLEKPSIMPLCVLFCLLPFHLTVVGKVKKKKKIGKAARRFWWVGGSPKNLDHFGLIAHSNFILRGRWLWKKEVNYYFSWLSHIKNDIAKGVRSCARDDYIIDLPIWRKIWSEAISQLEFDFSEDCALGGYVTNRKAILSRLVII